MKFQTIGKTHNAAVKGQTIKQDRNIGKLTFPTLNKHVYISFNGYALHKTNINCKVRHVCKNLKKLGIISNFTTGCALNQLKTFIV